MHLGFHYHLPAFEENGKIYTIAFQGLFIDSLAEYCDQITLFLFTPTQAERKEMQYAIHSKKVKLVSLMKHYNIPLRILLYPTIRKQIKTMINTLDILLMRAPTPLLPLITKDIKGKIPFAYLVVGEMSLHVDSIKQQEWRKSLIRQYVNWNESNQEKHAKDALIFANSSAAFEKYKTLSNNCVQVKTTTLRNEDFYFREDTCLDPPYQILFTGRIEQEKGLLEITEAIGKLHQESIDCRLNIVGWILPKDPTEILIRKIASEYGIEDKIIFHGFKSAGEELFSFYKAADLFIVASQNNEGFPRTIWEALANSVPVICTPVGSISQVLKNEYNAIFIEPKNSESIKEKIKFLIQNPSKRKEIIQNGLETVKEVTLEIQSKKMMDAIKSFITP